MKKLIILSLVLFPLLCFAEDKSFHNYNAHRNANDRIFDEFFKEYGADIKAAAILSACDRKDLSSKYCPCYEKIMSVLPIIMKNIADEKTPEGTYLLSLTMDQKILFMDSIFSEISVYEAGFRDAAKMFIKNNKAFCEEVVKSVYQSPPSLK